MCFCRFLQNVAIVIICYWLFCAFCYLMSYKRFYILPRDKSATIYYCANKHRIIVKYESALYLLTLTFPRINHATIFFVRHNPSAGNDKRQISPMHNQSAHAWKPHPPTTALPTHYPHTIYFWSKRFNSTICQGVTALMTPISKQIL